MYQAILAALFTGGVFCLIIGGIKEDDKRWAQRNCQHDFHDLEPVIWGPPWSRKFETHCTGCGVNMEYKEVGANA